MKWRAFIAMCTVAFALVVIGPAAAQAGTSSGISIETIEVSGGGSTITGRVSGAQDCRRAAAAVDKGSEGCSASVQDCRPNRRVKVLKDGALFAQTRTNSKGNFRFTIDGFLPKGTYVATVEKSTVKRNGETFHCKGGTSPPRTV